MLLPVHIALLELKRYLANRGELAFSIALPVVLFALMYGAFGGGGDSAFDVTVDLVDLDGGVHARALVDGLDSVDPGALVFHAGTRESEDGAVVTNGGRVVTVAALGSTVAEARGEAYANAARIGFTGSFYRSDIADVGGST